MERMLPSSVLGSCADSNGQGPTEWLRLGEFLWYGWLICIHRELLASLDLLFWLGFAAEHRVHTSTITPALGK